VALYVVVCLTPAGGQVTHRQDEMTHRQDEMTHRQDDAMTHRQAAFVLAGHWLRHVLRNAVLK
jgi:hypothetical protein